MNVINENAIYLITNIFRTYVLLRFLGIFLNRKVGINKKTEIYLYTSYYLINSTLSLAFSNPFINLISNLILFYLLTLMYNGKTFTRIVSTVIMYSSSMIIESIVYNVTINYSYFARHRDFSIVASNLLLFILTILLERKFGKGMSINIKGFHLFLIFFIPLGSIAIVAIVFLADINSVFTIVIVSILFFMNIINFYLYGILIKHYNDKYEKNLLEQQNNAYLNQLGIIKESQKNIKMLRHDMKNHIISIQNMVKGAGNLELNNYLQTMFNNVDNKEEHVNSGNVEIDSLLNYKISEAVKLDTNIDIDINIPNYFELELFDLVVILGNLLDNSLEALKKVSKRYLNVEMKLEKSMLFIRIKNTYDGIINKENDRILTTKNDVSDHGLGLMNVENIVNKYNGSLVVGYDDNMFSVDVILYVSKTAKSFQKQVSNF